MQSTLDRDLFEARPPVERPIGQFLKWIGNKQRFAPQIVSAFPDEIGTYYEPFVGSGAVLATLAPERAVASDAFAPLIELWRALKNDPSTVVHWYSERHALAERIGKKEGYAEVLASYNARPNGADLLYLSRTCYGGVVRFRKSDGYMSTPCGVHTAMPPEKFAKRAVEWHRRIQGTEFIHSDYKAVLATAKAGDLVYCDPPYVDSQAILYGAQAFRLPELYDAIADCKRRGVLVALSIDGTKKSGKNVVTINPPEGLFEEEAFIDVGRSMLRRFQLDGQTLEHEVVSDRLLLTY